jgi:phosphotransferase system enzyme I (PtsI)
MSIHSKTFKGIKVSAGIAIGKAVVISHTFKDVVVRRINPDEVEAEKNRFISAIRLITEQTDRLLAGMTPKELKKIGPHINVQKMLLSDLRFAEDVLNIISSELVSSEVAVTRSLDRYLKQLSSKEKSSLNARSLDIKSIEFLLLRILSGKIRDVSILSEEFILVTHDITPTELYYYSKHRMIGLITESGGRNSHASIVARSLNIPAVAGIPGITQAINTADKVILDGIGGIVIVHPNQKQIAEYSQKRTSFCLLIESQQVNRQTEFLSRDGIRVSVLANIDFPEEVDIAKSLGADGIGLLRTEFYFIERPRTPSEEEQFKSYDYIAEKFYPKEVTIRTLDVGGEKIPGFISPQKEENPALGVRAIRFCLKNKNLFLSQIKAILRASYRGNVRILIPMISKMEEIIETRRLIEEAKQILTDENKRFDPNIKVGIMLEIPSIIFIMEDVAKHIDFFSLGTNDLIQFIMAADRGNIELFDSASSLSPSIIRVLYTIIEKARSLDKPIYVCGEMAAEEEDIVVLLGMGYRHLSMSPINIPMFMSIIKDIDIKKAEGLVKNIISFENDSDIIREVERFLSEKDNIV